MNSFNLPQRNATWAMIAIAVFIFLISLKWIFFISDLSQFLIYILAGGIYLVLSNLLEHQSLDQKKLNNLEHRLDSIQYPPQ